MADPGIHSKQKTGAAPEADTGAETLLVRRLADLVLLPPGHMPRPDRDLLDLALSRVYPRLGMALKRRLSERTAQMTEPLPHLTRDLARDVPPVAEPLLLEGVHVPEAVLIEAADVSAKHRALLALREEVSPALSETIIRHDDEDAVYLLLANPGSKLPPRAIEMAVRSASGRESWHRPLVLRRELTVWTASLLFWWVDHELRQTLVRFHLADTALPALAIEETLGRKAEGRDGGLAPLMRFFTPLPLLTEDHLDSLRAAHEEAGAETFLAQLAEGTGLRLETLSRIFADEGGEPAAVLTRALGLPFSAAVDLAERGAGKPVEAEKEERIKVMFEELTVARATALLELWDEAMSGEIADLHAEAARRTAL